MKLNSALLEELLGKIPEKKIALIGDGCVDIYWEADMRRSQLSRESPHFPLPVVEERFSLGAAANVVANLAALGVKNLRYVSPVGEDWRGALLEQLLEKIGVSTDYLVKSEEIWTPAYCKPIRGGISPVRYEDPRIDFANGRPLPAQVEEKLLEEVEQAAKECELLVLCDQFAFGCVSEKLIERINELGEKMPVLVDSRDRIGRYKNVIVKPNEVEACACLGIPPVKTKGEMEQVARALEKKTGKPVVITLGAEGALWCGAGDCVSVPAFSVEPPIDFVGAGDSFLAAFAAGFQQQEDPRGALAFACLASSVTIKKLGVTGTASPAELREALERQRGDRT